MRMLLIILPYAGLILTTLSAVWGLTHELYTKKENNERRLTTAGRYSIAFSLLGLFISLNTSVLKTVIDNQDKAEAKATTDQQRQEAALGRLEEKARAQELRDEQRKTQEQIDRNDQQQQKRDLALSRQQIQGFSRTLHPLFPIEIAAIFRADLRTPSYAAYRERLVKAVPADEESLWPELAPGASLFPDKIREGKAYNLLMAPPQMRVFFYRKPADSFVSFEKEDPDLTIVLESTSADPPLPAGKKPSPRPQIIKEYAFSKDGIVSIHFPTERVNKPSYSNGQIVSDLDLRDVLMIIEISPWFTLYSINIELPGGREIQLTQEKFARSESRRHTLIYAFRFPKSQKAVEKLFVF